MKTLFTISDPVQQNFVFKVIIWIIIIDNNKDNNCHFACVRINHGCMIVHISHRQYHFTHGNDFNIIYYNGVPLH